MTPEDHNRTLGIMHLIYGGFTTLMMLMMTLFFGFIVALISSAPDVPPEFPAGLFALIFGLVIGINLLFGVLSLAAGYAMLKRKSWARLMGIISSVVAAMSFPFGTALCVYSLWFIFGEGKNFYDSPAFQTGARHTLNEAPAGFNEAWYAQEARRREREAEAAYVPPPQPPDWRDRGQ
ncbi:MAG TPA: hypothetical protein VER08_01270 [Pyrinomonadaceae bacterium]|nr:hypothetical protein [Pyrinomonadaceae bacterium]